MQVSITTEGVVWLGPLSVNQWRALWDVREKVEHADATAGELLRELEGVHDPEADELRGQAQRWRETVRLMRAQWEHIPEWPTLHELAEAERCALELRSG